MYKKRKEFFTRFSREDVLEKMQGIFNKWGVTSHAISESDNLWYDWEISSTEVINILQVFEKTYQIDFGDYDLAEEVVTIGDIVDAVEELVLLKAAEVA